MSGREYNKVCSTRSSSKSLKTEDTQEETPIINSKRQRTPPTVNESNTIKYGDNLVGSKVKVWWSYYGRFYEGVISSFDHVKRKHKVYYADGDVELLNLRQERWEFVDDDSIKNEDAEVEPSCHDTSSNTRMKKKKEGNTNLESLKSCKLKDTAAKSGGKSKDDGKPKSEIRVNNSNRSRNYVDAGIKPWILACEYEGDFGKASGGKSKSDFGKASGGKSKSDLGKASAGMSKDDGKPESEINVNNSGPNSNYVDDAAIKPQKLGGESQNGKPPTKTSSPPKVKESGTALPKTTPSSSKGCEGNSIWPTAIKSTLRRLSQMLDDGIHSDVTIITPDGSIKAHRSILSASSPVFRSMFQRENVSTVEIKEMTSESCTALVSFLYGSLNQEGFWKHRLDLLGAANKYDIVDLKDACQESLLEDINSGNVLERLQKAWVNKLDKLKKGCFTYLMDSEKINDMREEMNEFFQQADRGLLVEMYREVHVALKRS